jgi:hypothetical protein
MSGTGETCERGVKSRKCGIGLALDTLLSIVSHFPLFARGVETRA